MTANFEYYPDEGKAAPSAGNTISGDAEKKIVAFKQRNQAMGHKILGLVH